MLKPPFFVAEIGRKTAKVLQKNNQKNPKKSLVRVPGVPVYRDSAPKFLIMPLSFSSHRLKIFCDSKSKKYRRWKNRWGDTQSSLIRFFLFRQYGFLLIGGFLRRRMPEPPTESCPSRQAKKCSRTATSRPDIYANEARRSRQAVHGVLSPQGTLLLPHQRGPNCRASASTPGPRKAPTKAKALMQGMTGPIRPLAKPKPMTAPTAEPATTPLKGCWVMAPRIAKSPPQMIAPNSVAEKLTNRSVVPWS